MYLVYTIHITSAPGGIPVAKTKEEKLMATKNLENLNLRLATLEDIAGLVRTKRIVFTDSEENGTRQFDGRNEAERFTAAIANTSSGCVVAEEQANGKNVIVGYLLFSKVGEGELTKYFPRYMRKMGRGMGIDETAVIPSWRRRGVFSKMYDIFYEWAIKEGNTEVFGVFELTKIPIIMALLNVANRHNATFRCKKGNGNLMEVNHFWIGR